MNLDEIIAWVWENKEIIGLFAGVATALGALYQPTRDLLGFLLRAVWATIRFVFVAIWMISWPIRKLISVLYFRFAENTLIDFSRKYPIGLISEKQPKRLLLSNQQNNFFAV